MVSSTVWSLKPSSVFLEHNLRKIYHKKRRTISSQEVLDSVTADIFVPGCRLIKGSGAMISVISVSIRDVTADKENGGNDDHQVVVHDVQLGHAQLLWCHGSRLKAQVHQELKSILIPIYIDAKVNSV